MRELPNYRLAIRLYGPTKISYRYPEMIQTQLYSSIFRGSIIGEKVHQDKYSLFTYSLLADRPVFTQSGFKSNNGKWIFRFSSAYKELVSLVETGFSGNKINLLDEYNTFEIQGIYKEYILDRNIFQSQPILVISKDRKILRPEDQEYFRAIQINLERKWKFFFGSSAEQELKKLQFTRPPRQKRIQYKNRRLTSFAGGVKLQGGRDIIKFAQCVGLGHLTSCGFGMLI